MEKNDGDLASETVGQGGGEQQPRVSVTAAAGAGQHHGERRLGRWENGCLTFAALAAFGRGTCPEERR